MNNPILQQPFLRYVSCALLTFAFLTGGAYAATDKSGWDLLPDILSRIDPPSFPDRDFNIEDYGAVGDGKSDCNPAFKKAIAACTQAGGGRVLVPKGTFLTNGPIHLDDNVNLHVTKDAIILFGNHFDDYLPRVLVRWEGTECYSYSPLIYAHKKKNIAVTGSGTLNGQAEATWALWPGKTKPGTPSNNDLRQMNEGQNPVEDRIMSAKPCMIEPFECKNVLIEGVTLNDYPFWCVHPVYCTNVTIRKLVIDSHNSNNDGIDPDSCEDVLIEDCYLDQSDDDVAIKAGRNQDAWRVGKACRNIILRNMTDWKGAAIGSEMAGGVENVFIYDCEYESGNVLYCKSNLDRAGFIRDIYVKNLKIGKARVLRLRNNYHGYRGGNYPTDFRNIFIEDVEIEQGDDETISIAGVESAPVKDVFIKNVTVGPAPQPHLHVRHAENVVLTNVSIEGKIQPTHPPLLPPEEKEEEGTASITPTRSGLWSDTSLWETGRDGGGINWAGETADRLPKGETDERILIGKNDMSPAGVSVILDCDVDGPFEVRVYERSTLIIPEGYTLKIKNFRPDRSNSMVRQTGGSVEIGSDLQIDDHTCQYIITGGSISGNKLSLDEGSLTIDDRAGAIESIDFKAEFRTSNGDGATTTKFVANEDGVTPIKCGNVSLESYLGESLVVDISAYNSTKEGDLVLISYTGMRKGEFDGGPESPEPRVTIIGGQADLVYDDEAKQIKLTNIRG